MTYIYTCYKHYLVSANLNPATVVLTSWLYSFSLNFEENKSKLYVSIQCTRLLLQNKSRELNYRSFFNIFETKIAAENASNRDRLRFVSN